jgi:hypothetical protein
LDRAVYFVWRITNEIQSDILLVGGIWTPRPTTRWNYNVSSAMKNLSTLIDTYHQSVGHGSTCRGRHCQTLRCQWLSLASIP